MEKNTKKRLQTLIQKAITQLEYQGKVDMKKIPIKDYREEEKKVSEKNLKNLLEPYGKVAKTIRIQQRKTDLFKSLKEVDLNKQLGITVVIGRPKFDPGKVMVQSLSFDSKQWTLSKAKEWVKKNRKTIKSVEKI